MQPDRFDVHLVDGTYELFRHFYALPGVINADGEEVAAAAGVVGSMLGLIESGATHVAVATDHVIESFRNDLWPAYKTGEGIDPLLFAQFPILEDALEAAGFCVWRMERFEADDGLAAGAAAAAADERVRRVYICTPDKDLAQSVRDDRVVQLDRRQRIVRDAHAVREKFGVPPRSIPDYLALVGDSADGFPGVPGWGAKSAATLLARYHHLDAIPDDPDTWDVQVRGAARLAGALREHRRVAELFRELATLREDAPITRDPASWRWQGTRDAFGEVAARLGAPDLVERAAALRDGAA